MRRARFGAMQYCRKLLTVVVWVVVAAVWDSTVQKKRGSACWGPLYNARRCCDRQKGSSGDEACWDRNFSYALCCTIPVVHALVASSTPLRRASPVHWCGQSCADAPYGKVRPWEALRYQLLGKLALQSLPERRLLAGLAEVIRSTFTWHGKPLDLFSSSTIEALAPECPAGALALRFARAATGDLPPGLWPCPLGMVEAARDFLASAELVRRAYCSGWPVFRLMAAVAANLSFAGGSRVLQLRRSFYEAASMVDPPAGVLYAAFHNCMAAVASVADCLGAGLPLLHELHVTQGWQVLGLGGSCPPRSFVAWLDRMAPVAAFPLCVRSEYNLIDTDIKRMGTWNSCVDLSALLSSLGNPGCNVLDVGANIGVCTVMLAQLGYHVTAFEPLPRNADLLEASLRLNGFAGDNGHQSNWTQLQGSRVGGSAALRRVAVGHRSGMAHILEGVRNAGMSVVAPKWPVPMCDPKQFLCHQAREVPMVRLDDVWSLHDGPICLAKVDTEGGELSVLRGALELLRSRAIHTMYLEWWPPHLSAVGEEPVALLWLLNTLRYELFAPASWFTKDPEDMHWLMIVPDHFPWLLDHWGDIVAKAAEW